MPYWSAAIKKVVFLQHCNVTLLKTIIGKIWGIRA